MELKPRKISRTEPKNSPTMVPNPIFKAPSSEISSNSFNNSANGAPSPNKPAASMDGDGGSSGGCSLVEPKTDNLEDEDKKKNKNKEDDLRAYFNSFPPGYRFCPQDEELLVCYLRKRVNNELLPPNQINEVELYKYNPDELAEKYREFGEKEWYFFTPRDRKYQNGGRPKRSAGKGYWKATGADKPIKVHGNIVGFRKALVFYEGKPPKGEKTNWIMHEYRVSDPPPAPSKNKDSSKSMRLDKCVLCRIYQKDDKSFARSTRQRDDGSHRLVAASMEDDNEGDDGFVMEDHMESPGGFIINPNTGTTDHRFITGQKSPLQIHHESGGLPMDFHQHSNLLPQFNGQDQFQPMSFGHHSNARLRTPEPPMLPPYNDDDWAGILNSDKEFIFQSPYFDQFPPPPHPYPSTTTGLRYDPFLEGILQVPNSSSRNVVSPVTVRSSSMPPPAHNYHHVNVHSVSPLLGNSNPSFYMKDYKKSSPK